MTKPRTAPGPFGHPLYRNLADFRRDPIAFMMDAVRRYGDVVRVRIPFADRFFIRHPDHIKYILQDNNKNYTKNTRGFILLRTLLGNGLLTSDGSFWLRQRRIAQPAFHRDRIATFANLMTRATATMLDSWGAVAQRGEAIDVHAEMMRVTLRIVGEALLSADLTSDADIVAKALSVGLHQIQDRITRFNLPLAVPTPSNVRLRRALGALDRVVMEMIVARRQTGRDTGDLLSMLMHARDEETGESMTDAQLRDEVMTILLAGHETSANALTWGFYLLSTHPAVYRELASEIASVLSDRMPTLADLPRLTFTRNVVDETMRLFPPAWAIARGVESDDEVGGYRIPAGSVVIASPYATHRHPEFWENPEGFDPTRWAPDKIATLPRFAYLPFGGGPRQCIGNNFALMELVLIVAMATQRFRLDLVPGFKIELDPAVTLRTRHGMHMTPHQLN